MYTCWSGDTQTDKTIYDITSISFDVLKLSLLHSREKKSIPFLPQHVKIFVLTAFYGLT